MRNSISLKLLLVLICYTLIGCEKVKHEPTNESTASFNTVFGNIDWNNSTLDKDSDKRTCSNDLWNRASPYLPKKMKFKMNNFKSIMTDLLKVKFEVERLVKKYELGSKLSENTGLFTVEATDKIYNAFTNNEQKAQDFIKGLKKRQDGKTIDWKGEEAKFDKEMTTFFQKLSSIIYLSNKTKTTKGDCNIYVYEGLWVDKINRQNITIRAYCMIDFYCRCSNTSTTANIENGALTYSRNIEGSFPNNDFDFNTILFKPSRASTHKLFIDFCCNEE